MSRSRDENQALALAAVFQSALCAEELATRGRSTGTSFQALMASVLVLDPDRPEDVFPDPEPLSGGLRLLRQLFGEGQRQQQMRAIHYGLGLLHLANRLRKSTDLIAILRHRLEALRAQRPHFPDLAGPDFCRRAAGIYVDTLGSFHFRIRVQGDPDWLRNEDNAARIRAGFLAGVRAAFLWRQSGGRRWHLLLQRRRLLRATENLMKSSNIS